MNLVKWWMSERRFTIESEIATMKYVAKCCSTLGSWHLGEHKSKTQKSIASIQVRSIPSIVFILLTSSVVPSVKCQLCRSASLDPLSRGQTGQLILVHFQRHLALKYRLRRRWVFSLVGRSCKTLEFGLPPRSSCSQRWALEA